MKKQDINRVYTEELGKAINEGYVIDSFINNFALRLKKGESEMTIWLEYGSAFSLENYAYRIVVEKDDTTVVEKRYYEISGLAGVVRNNRWYGTQEEAVQANERRNGRYRLKERRAKK